MAIARMGGRMPGMARTTLVAASILGALVVASVAIAVVDRFGVTHAAPVYLQIYNGYYDPDGHYNPGIISSAPPGASDAKAIAWMNTQFSRYGYSFYYVAVTPSSQGAFMAEIRFDVSDYEAAYVRVDLSTASGTGYPWYQAPDPKKGHVLHATLAVGYDDSAGTVRSYDPFTHTTSSGCSTYYSSSYDWACNWMITQTRYWRGMDRTVGTPLWF